MARGKKAQKVRTENRRYERRLGTIIRNALMPYPRPGKGKADAKGPRRQKEVKVKGDIL